MLRVALTGNVASGKSAVAAIWENAGVPVVRADRLSRLAVAVGSSTLEEIRATFGDAVLTPDGELDRDRMREIVFSDTEARRRLEAIVHPRIEALRREWAAAREREGAAVAVFEIPLLFELGMEEQFDVVVVVDAPAPEREERLVRTRGLTRAQARKIMESQGDSERKRMAADHVIRNDADLDTLGDSAREVLRRIRGEGRADP